MARKLYRMDPAKIEENKMRRLLVKAQKYPHQLTDEETLFMLEVLEDIKKDIDNQENTKENKD